MQGFLQTERVFDAQRTRSVPACRATLDGTG